MKMMNIKNMYYPDNFLKIIFGGNMKILLVFTLFFILTVSKGNSQTDNLTLSQKEALQEITEVTDIIVSEQLVTVVCSTVPKFSKFYLDSPPRVVVDIKGILKFEKEEVLVTSSYIKRVRVKQFKTEPEKVVRVVLDLIKKYPYKVETKNHNILVSVIPPVMKVVKQESPSQQKFKQEIPSEEEVSSQVIEETSSVQPSVSQQEKILQPQQKTKALTQKKNSTKKEEILEKKPSLPKVMVTLECVDADITDVLQMLAIKADVNIIYGPDVTGKITISLRNVPFDKAFENILRISKLAYIQVAENVIRVGTPQTLEQERAMQVVYTKIFPLNYAVADDVKMYLEQIRQAEGRTKGMIAVDKRTNSLIVTESEEGLKYIEEWIKKLDTKPYQVSIEAQVIDISIDDLSELGVQWGVRSVETQPGSGVNYTLEQVGGAGVTVSEVNATAREVQSSMLVAPTGAPIESAVFLFGKFTDALAISGRLAMLITQGKAKVLSNPRVTTMNNKTAVIIAGEKIPYKSAVTQTTTGAGTGVGQTVQETWEYINAGIQLTVTPTVSPDGWITLNVKPQVDIPQISAPGVPPTVKSRQTEVTVMVKNNEPLIIGGLISDSDIDAIKKIPLLGDLPILGYLFKYKTSTKRRTELIILITPRIIEN